MWGKYLDKSVADTLCEYPCLHKLSGIVERHVAEAVSRTLGAHIIDTDRVEVACFDISGENKAELVHNAVPAVVCGSHT